MVAPRDGRCPGGLPGASGEGRLSTWGPLPTPRLSDRLCLPAGSPGPAGDHSSGASSPLFDSGLHLNSNPSSTVSTASRTLTERGCMSPHAPQN